MKVVTEIYEIRVWSWLEDNTKFVSNRKEDTKWIKQKFSEYASPAEVIEVYIEDNVEIGYTIKWNGNYPNPKDIQSACHKTTVEYLIRRANDGV